MNRVKGVCLPDKLISRLWPTAHAGGGAGGWPPTPSCDDLIANLNYNRPQVLQEGASIMNENPFVGVWKLVTCDAVRKKHGRVPIYGKKPIGRLYYDAAGNMSVHIMKAGRPRSESATKFGVAPDEMRLAYEGYEAYFSTYVFDSQRHLISHTVIGGLFPNWTGTVQERFYRFEGDRRLILSSEPLGAASGDNTSVTLVWERLA
jgi:hypothetical protein